MLDLCAAPGGKATELAARLQGRGFLLANDISASRAGGLLKNLELAGAANILVASEDPGRLAEAWPEGFDKILVDAPCSGEGMFRRDSRMAAYWEQAGAGFLRGSPGPAAPGRLADAAPRRKAALFHLHLFSKRK